MLEVVTETDLELSDGRTLHVYDASAGDPHDRLPVFWHHGTPNIGAPPEPLLPAAAELASGSCRMTGPDTADRLLTRAGTWHRRPLRYPASPMRWVSGDSRSWATRAEARTPWHPAIQMPVGLRRTCMQRISSPTTLCGFGIEIHELGSVRSAQPDGGGTVLSLLRNDLGASPSGRPV